VAETVRLGATLGRLAPGGTVLLLVGTLGSGKTAFVQGVARGLGITDAVQSPTFTLINEHATPARHLVLYHVDLYRLRDVREVVDLGLPEVCGAAHAICAIEWADRAEGVVPREHLRLELAIAGVRSRHLRFRASGPAHAALLDAFRQAIAAGEAAGAGRGALAFQR
jgi:tRNA threonylcarbamoyladenosine biosynthesis protein TsaE